MTKIHSVNASLIKIALSFILIYATCINVYSQSNINIKSGIEAFNNQDYKKALQNFNALASSGNSEALGWLGYM